MRKVIWLLLLVTACSSKRAVSFDPFHYDANAYEEVDQYYTIKGTGDTTLLFIHGWNLDHSYWLNQEEAFAPGYKVVLLDLAGCGQSGKNRIHWTIESFARDISNIINREQLRNVVLVAHSMGGEIALDVAAANPERVIGIVGVDNLKNAGATISEEDKNGMQPFIKEFVANYPAMAEDMARSFIVSKDSAVVHRVVASYRTADPAVAIPTLMYLYPKSAEVKKKLREIPFEMKFIMCTNTPYDAEAFNKYCTKGYQLITLDSAGHFPMIERPEAFNKALRRLLTTP